LYWSRTGEWTGIATSYGLEGPGIESWLGRDFPARVQIVRRDHTASCITGTSSHSHPPQLAPRLKKG